jgi:hypothetical protein
VARAHLTHYERTGVVPTEERLRVLYEITVECVRRRFVQPILRHAEAVATERFHAGFDLGEIQTAFNVLEEAIWTQVQHEIPPEEQAEALGMISTVLGAGKDKLAQTYVTLACHAKVPALDVGALYGGKSER